MRILNITILSNLALKYLNLRAPQICCLLIRNYVAAILSLLSVSQCTPRLRSTVLSAAIGTLRVWKVCDRNQFWAFTDRQRCRFLDRLVLFFSIAHITWPISSKARGHPRNTGLPLVDKLHRRLIGHNWFLAATPSELLFNYATHSYHRRLDKTFDIN